MSITAIVVLMCGFHQQHSETMTQLLLVPIHDHFWAVQKLDVEKRFPVPHLLSIICRKLLPFNSVAPKGMPAGSARNPKGRSRQSILLCLMSFQYIFNLRSPKTCLTEQGLTWPNSVESGHQKMSPRGTEVTIAIAFRGVTNLSHFVSATRSSVVR